MPVIACMCVCTHLHVCVCICVCMGRRLCMHTCLCVHARLQEESCGNCNRPGHMMKDCSNNSFCINCKGNHKPNNKKCEAYGRKTETFATQARKRVTYYEASERVREWYVELGRTFREVVGGVQREQLD